MSREYRLPFLLALGAGYGLLAALAISLTRLSGGVALLWVANAPLLVALSMLRPVHWRGPVLAAAIGSMAASLIVSPLASVAFLFVVANMAEAVIAAALLRRWNVFDPPLASARSVALFVLAAGAIAPALSGIAAAAFTSMIVNHSFGGIWVDWVIGHGLGSLIATPIALLVLQPGRMVEKFASRVHILEAAGLMLLVAAVTFGTFSQNTLPLLFLISLPVLIATMRLHRLGAASSVAIVAVIGGYMTLRGAGPIMLVHVSEAAQLQFFQLFLAVQFLIALPVAAILSERASLFRALRESEARYRLLADNATDAMLTLDPDGTIRFASAATRELGFFEPRSLVGRSALSLIVEEDRERVREVHYAALARPDESFSVEYRVLKANGEISWFESNMRAVAEEDGVVTSAVSVIRAVGVRKAREAELYRQATTDPLTGLLNRGAIRRRIDQAAASDAPAALALFDLDHFKQVNDRHGHPTGDAVLLAFADLLHDSLRGDDAVGRIGGEEFAVVFNGMTVLQAQTACARLRAAVAAQPLAMGMDGPIFVTVSVGLVALEGNISEAYQAADRALYAAKAHGRNRVELAEAA
ncbi:sensor domain-containing diguanylate cyclase [Sphingomonas sp. G-3-2-10]|uniref:sensor domain-containing diguanylate cyclase n=1 Tax=Sphingomonas sp. G-3-2-10 TaxID=2728838 RepID=UPI00146F0C16|nr:sensor domain-containing diguanylate cyclase [Sphingomonas sp. G-3-2-10]NML07079.1 diguanylate cyclase [Sphingomonas sp. G-3-2-10]